MTWLRRGSSEPLWKEEFPVRTADERYVTRRQLTKFLVLTSLGMFVGNIWILIRSIFYKAPIYGHQPVAQLGEIPVGGVKLFSYPSKDDHCILIRTAEDEYVGYSQKCTHHGELCGEHAVILGLILRRSMQSVRRLDL